MESLENLKFDWQAGLTPGSKVEDGSLIISGELVNTEVCANNFALDENELPNLANQVKNVTLRLDHSKSVRDVVGGLKLGTYDKDKKRIMFEAEVDDPNIQKAIMKGRLKYISIGATADAFCSKCSKPTKPFKTCSCKNSHDIIKNIRLKEASIVTDPAYTSSTFMPQGFTASITSALAENQVTPSSKEEARPIISENKMEEERKMSEIKKESIDATTLKPAGTDAVVLLGQKLEALAGLVSKMEERFKKQDDDEAKKKKDEDEAKKKDDYANIIKSEFANISTKLEGLVKQEWPKPKKDDEAKKEDKATFSNVPASGGIPKDVKHEGKKEPPTEEEEDEEPKEKTKKEKVQAGAKIENASETQVEVTADTVPAWFKEVKAFAQKNNILD